MRPVIAAEIKQEPSSLTIVANSESPALLGEWLPVVITVSTSQEVTNAQLSVVLVLDGGNDQSSMFLKIFNYPRLFLHIKFNPKDVLRKS